MIAKTETYDHSTMVGREMHKHDVEITYHRENWKEWIKFDLDNMYLREGRSIPYMWAYGKVRRDYAIDITEFWIYPLFVFVWTFYWLLDRWWNFARFCKKKGWIIKLKEGRGYYWFWPKYLKIWQKVKKKLNLT